MSENNYYGIDDSNEWKNANRCVRNMRNFLMCRTNTITTQNDHRHRVDDDDDEDEKK